MIKYLNENELIVSSDSRTSFHDFLLRLPLRQCRFMEGGELRRSLLRFPVVYVCSYCSNVPLSDLKQMCMGVVCLYKHCDSFMSSLSRTLFQRTDRFLSMKLASMA